MWGLLDLLGVSAFPEAAVVELAGLVLVRLGRQVEFEPLVDVELFQFGVVTGVDTYLRPLARIVYDVAPLFLRSFFLGEFDRKDLLDVDEYLHVYVWLIS